MPRQKREIRLPAIMVEKDLYDRMSRIPLPMVDVRRAAYAAFVDKCYKQGYLIKVEETPETSF